MILFEEKPISSGSLYATKNDMFHLAITIQQFSSSGLIQYVR